MAFNAFQSMLWVATLFVLCFPANGAELQDLKSEKELLEARAARDEAATKAIQAEAALAKAKAAAADTAGAIQKSQYDTAAALTKSRIAAETAQIDALKSTFGAPPSIGGDGTVSITDASTTTLLQVRAGSLEITWRLAQKLCSVLAEKNVENAYIAPVELDLKVQNARMVLREFNSVSEFVNRRENRDLVDLDGAQPQVTFVEGLAAVTLLQYGAGALEDISKLFRANYAVGLSSEATRGAWLEHFMVDRCPKQIPKANVEAAVRRQSIDTSLTKLNALQEFHNAATAKKSLGEKQIAQHSERIKALKAEKKDTSAQEEQLRAQQEIMRRLLLLDAWLSRIEALLKIASTTPGVLLDALTWIAFADDENVLKLSERPRLTLVLTTQDGQITRSFWLSGKTLYGRSAGELLYRVEHPDRGLITAGFLTASYTTGELDFDQPGTQVSEDIHKRYSESQSN